jgi:hypothetical protein
MKAEAAGSSKWRYAPPSSDGITVHSTNKDLGPQPTVSWRSVGAVCYTPCWNLIRSKTFIRHYFCYC